MKPVSKSTLFPYPGGKSRAAKLIVSYFPAVKRMFSPFVGGGSVELLAASRGIEVRASDSFPPLVRFWEWAASNPDVLADKISESMPLKPDEFYRLRDRDPGTMDDLNTAAAFWLLHAYSFSGFGYSGAYSDSKQPTQAAVDSVRNFYAPNFHVEECGYEESIEAAGDDFIYADPPYDIERHLYGRMGSNHKNFDHERFAEMIRKRKNWIVSYNSTDRIMANFRDCKMLSPRWIYSIRSDIGSCLPSNELLIFSDEAWARHESDSLLAWCI